MHKKQCTSYPCVSKVCVSKVCVSKVRVGNGFVMQVLACGIALRGPGRAWCPGVVCLVFAVCRGKFLHFGIPLLSAQKMAGEALGRC